MAKYSRFIDSRKYLDPEIKYCEMFSKFKYVDRHKFTKFQGDDETVLRDVFSPWEKELGIYQILSNIKVNENIA